MNNIKLFLRPLIEIDDSEKFYRGTLLRKYNVNSLTSIPGSEDDFYDYLLVHLLWDKMNMLVVNVTKNNSKLGAVYSGVIPVSGLPEEFTVNKEGFRHAFGKDLKDWYLIENPDSL